MTFGPSGAKTTHGFADAESNTLSEPAGGAIMGTDSALIDASLGRGPDRRASQLSRRELSIYVLAARGQRGRREAVRENERRCRRMDRILAARGASQCFGWAICDRWRR